MKFKTGMKMAMPKMSMKSPKMPKAGKMPKSPAPPGGLADHRPPTNHDDFHALGQPKGGKY